MGGSDPYSVSKGCAELLTTAWRRSYFEKSGVVLASARAGNVIGGGDWAADRIIPDLVRGVVADETISIRSPGAIRPWQHVLEPLSGYIQLAAELGEHGAGFAQGWNFGPGNDIPLTVGELATDIVREFGKGKLELATQPPGLHEAQNLKLDSSLAATKLGWRALLSNRQRVEWTVNWYRNAYEQPESMRTLTEQQISLYEEGIRACPRMQTSWFAASPASSAQRSRAA
jgi:CDP-glucose 4,6-dehydratase